MKPYWSSSDHKLSIYHGDARTVLEQLPEGSVQTCVTSPPYWGLRDYGVEGQLGLEPTPEQYVTNMVEIFQGVRRVLRDDGTVWLNLGDSFTSGGRDGHGTRVGYKQQTNRGMSGNNDPPRAPQPPGLKPKDLCMIPARVALALQADGWWLRSDIIWAKTNPMPESVTDRPTNSHEHIFLLAKSARYWYDADAIREPLAEATLQDLAQRKEPGKHDGLTKQLGKGAGLGAGPRVSGAGRNKRNVWTVNTQPFPGAHFAVFPEKLIEPCVLAGSAARSCAECGAAWERVVEKERTFESGSGRSGNLPGGKNGADLQGGGATLDIRRGPCVHTQTLGFQPTCDCEADTRPSLVLDPFGGAGTTLLCAYHQGRRAVMVELSEEYCELAAKRLEEATDQGRLFEPAEVATAQPAQLVMEQDAEGMAQCTLTT